MIYGARKGSGWADVCELDDKNWQFTVGYFETRTGDAVIYERKSNISTAANAVTAMDAAYIRMEKSVKNVGR